MPSRTMRAAPHAGHSGFGAMLREWRRARGPSQLELALACGLSQRHLSFLETGRSRPSRGMVLHLASMLDVPLDQQNVMLLAAGFAPIYAERPLDAPDMRAVDSAIGQALRRQDPYPGILVDGAYNILRANEALSTLLGFLLGAEAAALAPTNAAEIVLHPDGLRPVMENWEEVGVWLIRRLRAEAMVETRDHRIGTLLERVLGWPGVREIERIAPVDRPLPPVLTLRFRRDDVRLALFSMIATLGTPLDVSLQDMRLELFFPADDATANWFTE